MSKKRDPILVAAWESPEATNNFLREHYRLPQEPTTRKEVQQDSIRVIDPNTKRPTPVSLDEAGGYWGSETQQTDELQSLLLESGENANVKLSPAWLSYLEYMDVIAEALFPEDKGAALKHRAWADARSRYWEQPPNLVQPMNAPLGSAAEFRERWTYGELDIRPRRAVNRRDHVIEVWLLPPDEQEELDEPGEPRGRWDGLKWTPEPS
jgi:hypothetical protein